MRDRKKGTHKYHPVRRLLLPLSAVLVIVWMSVIFAFSAQQDTESAAVSGGVCYRIAEGWDKAFHLGQTEEELLAVAQRIEHPVRKGAHMSEYGVLALLFFALISFFRWMPARSSCLLALILAFLYACTDEFHQRFVPGRSGSFIDVMIDTSGAALVMLFVFLVICLVGRRKSRERKRTIIRMIEKERGDDCGRIG